MKREIKFRAWATQANKMIDLKTITPLACDPGLLEHGDGLFIPFRDDILLMQFTGLKDKNGVDIYEGDIGRIAAMSGRVELFTVEWGIHRREMKSGWTVDIPSFAFVIDGFPTFPIVDNYLNGHDLDIIEIIGNIHQNPELLK